VPATLEEFLENCEHGDPYIQNIWMAARYLVKARVGHCETQYESGTTLWSALGSHHSIPRIPYEPRKPRIVVTIHRELLALVVSDDLRYGFHGLEVLLVKSRVLI